MSDERTAELERLRTAIRKARYAAILDMPGPCTEEARDQGCICGWSSVNSASIDPPHEVIHKWCPLHGCDAARDPDAHNDAKRDDPPAPLWED